MGLSQGADLTRKVGRSSVCASHVVCFSWLQVVYKSTPETDTTHRSLRQHLWSHRCTTPIVKPPEERSSMLNGPNKVPENVPLGVAPKTTFP